MVGNAMTCRGEGRRERPLPVFRTSLYFSIEFTRPFALPRIHMHLDLLTATVHLRAATSIGVLPLKAGRCAPVLGVCTLYIKCFLMW